MAKLKGKKGKPTGGGRGGPGDGDPGRTGTGPGQGGEGNQDFGRRLRRLRVSLATSQLPTVTRRLLEQSAFSVRAVVVDSKGRESKGVWKHDAGAAIQKLASVAEVTVPRGTVRVELTVDRRKSGAEVLVSKKDITEGSKMFSLHSRRTPLDFRTLKLVLDEE